MFLFIIIFKCVLEKSRNIFNLGLLQNFKSSLNILFFIIYTWKVSAKTEISVDIPIKIIWYYTLYRLYNHYALLIILNVAKLRCSVRNIVTRLTIVNNGTFGTFNNFHCFKLSKINIVVRKFFYS